MKLLLGTDVQTSLGLSASLTTRDNVIDLLSGIEAACSPSVPKVDKTRHNHLPTSMWLSDKYPAVQMPGTPAEEKEATSIKEPPDLSFPTQVQLLTAVKVPVRHERLVRALVDDFPQDTTALFESAASHLTEKGISIEDTAVQPDDQKQWTLVVRNNSLKPVVLEQDEVLGNIQPAMVAEQAMHSPLLHLCLVAKLLTKDVSS